jgi:hypothetical protein
MQQCANLERGLKPATTCLHDDKFPTHEKSGLEMEPYLGIPWWALLIIPILSPEVSQAEEF